MSLQTALKDFAESVAAKSAQMAAGEPEDQLRAPFEQFVREAAAAKGFRDVVCTGETLLPGRLGRPDYAVHRNRLLAGYAELKAPGTGADPRRFRGANRAQWERFTAIPNLLYTDGNEWALYRGGELTGKIVRLPGDVLADGGKAVSAGCAAALEDLLRDFLSWEPFIPTGANGKIDLKGFAALLAPLCRMLRGDVTEALANPASPLNELAADWRQLLFPGATDEQFADAYAQTVTFGVLLGRSEGANPLTFQPAQEALASQHNLLSRALQVLTDKAARDDMAASLDLLQRVIAAVPPSTLSGPEDPWLYFYEDFLAAYDPKLRKNAGAYYTPLEVVRAQVRLVDDILVNELNRPLGFADPGVVTLDPAAGTGTYLLGVVEHTLGRVAIEEGAGALPGRATTLAANLKGFELMVGPYAVADLRVSRALRDKGARLPKDGLGIFLTDTLENPNANPPVFPFILKPLGDQRAKALKLKSETPVLVCLGNPPYDRHEAASGGNQVRTGGWVRWGDDDKGGGAILRDFTDPVSASGGGVHLKNLYNLYVYFWRWALWKVFESESAAGPGVASFITASSFIEGDAFAGMREHMRRACDEIWILDLGGEGRGARKSENVFAIQTPVAICIAFRRGAASPDRPARVRYFRVEGGRAEKLAALDRIRGFRKVKWQTCPKEWGAPFRPAGKGTYFGWPLLKDLMPWQHSGVQFKRTWPIAHDPALLERRWRAMLAAKDRAEAFKVTRDRNIERPQPAIPPHLEGGDAIGDLPGNAPAPAAVRYAFRSFDRQWALADNRLADYPRPALWSASGSKQIFLTSLLSRVLGKGPAVTACSRVPDLHHFTQGCGKDIIPLYRDADGEIPNILPELLELLGRTLRRGISPEDFAAYLYGLLAHPAFAARHSEELATRELRIPLTKNPALFEKIRAAGARLLWLHTYGERFIPKGRRTGEIPRGSARCLKPIAPDPESYPEDFSHDPGKERLRVGAGEFGPVSPAVFDYEVSGLKVVQSWLKYRMKKGGGKRSSPLDDIRPEIWRAEDTAELLELLWVLEATISDHPALAALLTEAEEGHCIEASELPPVPPESRLPPGTARPAGRDLFDGLEPD